MSKLLSPVAVSDQDPIRPFAVITGASRGIGAEYARALAARGHDLLLVAREQARLDRLALELRGCYRIEVDVEVMDLAEVGAADRLYAAVRRRRDAIDLLVNNAGFGAFGSFVEMPMPRVQGMLRLHINTIVESLRLFLPGMIERRSGAIINVASVAGFFVIPHFAEYAATKTFLIVFSQAVAEEVRPFGVTVQVCCPGSTETDFHTTAGFRPKNPLGAQSPAEVVSRSLSALRGGPVVLTTDWRGRLLAAVSRCAPRGLLIKAAAGWMKPNR